jgi:hypothetical protein
MPQPLKTLLRGTTTFSYIEQLPTQHPQLCALAMAVIAEWSALDGALLGLLTTMFPGRAEPIAEYYTTLRSDGPKTAMLHALARAVMDGPEIAVYDKLQKRYEASYSLRNPLAHWVLGHSPELPEAIIATDSRSYQKFLAAGDDDLAEIVKRAKSGEIPSLDHFSKGPTRSHAMLGESQVYREKDLTDIRTHLATTRRYFFDFKFILNWRAHGFQPEKRSQLFAQLCQTLGLPRPTAS